MVNCIVKDLKLIGPISGRIHEKDFAVLVHYLYAFSVSKMSIHVCPK